MRERVRGERERQTTCLLFLRTFPLSMRQVKMCVVPCHNHRVIYLPATLHITTTSDLTVTLESAGGGGGGGGRECSN